MEREILFRGLNEKGVFVEGHYYYELNDGHLIVETRHDAGDGRTTPPCDYQEFERIDPETIGQYTGLKDKNGVEIFEGDVLKNKHIFGVDDEDHGEVIFAGGCFMIKYPYQSLDLVEDVKELEVIGNIHQNPELLTTKN